MPVSNREAWDLKQRGRIVSVPCSDCGELVWTSDAEYLHGADEWTCSDCNDEFVEDLIEEMVDG